MLCAIALHCPHATTFHGGLGMREGKESGSFTHSSLEHPLNDSNFPNEHVRWHRTETCSESIPNNR